MDSMHTPEDVEATASVWLDGQAVTIEGAGHVVHKDRFEAFLSAVKTFLSEMD